jgi:WD40 repeat protein
MVSSLDVRGGIICTGSWDGGVKCWSLLPTGIDETPLVELFDKQVRAVQMDESARLVAAGTDDGSVTIWDTRCAISLRTHISFNSTTDLLLFEKGVLEAGLDDIHVLFSQRSSFCVQLSADSYPVAAAQSDMHACALRVPHVSMCDGCRTKVPVSTFAGSEGGAAVTSLCWRAGSSQVYTCAKDGSLRLSNIDGGCVAGCRVDSDVRCIEVGRFAGEEVVVGGCGDASLRGWGLDGEGMGERWAVSGAHEAALTAVHVDWENGIIATGSKDSFIRLWRPVSV